MTRVAIYARVSTTDKEQDPATQIRELHLWAQAQGMDPASFQTYVERVSGAKADRPELRRLLEAAHRREIDEVWVWALDRLSREGIGATLAYIQRLRLAGVRVRSLRESWCDTAGPVTDLLFAIFAWVAAHERERIRERVQAGLARAKQHGTRSGRPIGRPPRVLSASAVALYLRTHSVAATARHFGVARATIRAQRAARPDLFTAPVPA